MYAIRSYYGDMPRGMIYSLIICTVIYVITTLVITGLVPYSSLKGVADPLAFVFDQINMHKIGFFISVTAVVASTSVLLRITSYNVCYTKLLRQNFKQLC